MLVLAFLPLAEPSTVPPIGALFHITSGDACELLPGALCVRASRFDSIPSALYFQVMEAVSLTHADIVLRPPHLRRHVPDLAARQEGVPELSVSG